MNVHNLTLLSAINAFCFLCIFIFALYIYFFWLREEIRVNRVFYSKSNHRIITPKRGTELSAGIDIFIPEFSEDIHIKPQESALIDSGIAIDIPDDYCVVAMNKGSVATQKNLIVGAHLIDADYQGTIRIHLINYGNTEITLSAGDKITQLVFIPVIYPEFIEVDKNKLFAITTERGEGGFGSTGNN